MENAIKFALWLSKNMYEDMYEDVKGDGKTWASYLREDECSCLDYHSANRFTIEELYNKYITQ